MEWKLPGLGAHLDNLDLEAEPDQDLCSKEKKKVRRAMRNLAGGLGGHRHPRRPLVFVVHDGGGEKRDQVWRATGAEVIEFDHGSRWDFSKGVRREAFINLVRKFDPDLLMIEPGVAQSRWSAEQDLRERVRQRVVNCFCHRLCKERIGDGRATMWVEYNLEHDFEKEEKEALECQGAVFCTTAPGTRSYSPTGRASTSRHARETPRATDLPKQFEA